MKHKEASVQKGASEEREYKEMYKRECKNGRYT